MDKIFSRKKKGEGKDSKKKGDGKDKGSPKEELKHEDRESDKSPTNNGKDSKHNNHNQEKESKEGDNNSEKVEEKKDEVEDFEEDEDSSGDEEEEKKGPYTFDWKVEKFMSLEDKKQESEVFVLDECKWRILLFPFGTQNARMRNEVSVYLDVADTNLPHSWSRNAKFHFIIVNQKDHSKTITRTAQHRFNSYEKDWGFSGIIPRADLSQGFLVDDVLHIHVEAKVLRTTYYSNWDSKKETGFVGVKNQGATCYMNSLLQALYHISPFRTEVYKMPTQNDEPESSIPLALQRVLYRMQFGDKSVGTKELTQSFGWNRRDAFVQHDVQELNRVFCDNLESKMKGTISEGIIERLFRGKTYNYIKCTNVDFESSRVETFYDVSLNVKGMKDLKASLDDYIAPELLTGENKYDAGKFGLQDAKKGCYFQSLPPVLEFHLKRFIYDPQTDRNCKINDRYEYPRSINLSKYMHKDAVTDKSVKPVYRLYAVLVHQGDVHGGHYYAYVRPSIRNKWYKFDDERVTKVRSKEVFEESFGGEEISYLNKNLNGKKQLTMSPIKGMSRTTSAYMLFYILDSAREHILAPVPDSAVPAHLGERFQKEEAAKREQEKEAAEAHLYCKVKVVLLSDLQKWRSFDLINFDSVQSFKVKKSSTLKEFKNQMNVCFGIPEERQRYWNWCKRRNHTNRPDTPFSPQDEDSTFEKLIKKPVNSPSELRVFLEVSEVAEPEGKATVEYFTPHSADDALVFFKFYDPLSRGEPLTFVTHLYVKVKSKVKDVIPKLRELKSFSSETELLLYEEIKTGMVEPVNIENTWVESELSNGDIICFQEKPSPEAVQPAPVAEVATTEGNKDATEPETGKLMLAPAYYEHMRNRVLVRFRKLEGIDSNGTSVEHGKKEITLELLKNMEYDEVVKKLGAQINVDPMKIRLTQHSLINDKPRHTPIKRSTNPNLTEMLSNVPNRMGPMNQRGGLSGGGLADILYYEELDISIKELEANKLLKIDWYNSKAQQKKTHKILVPKESKFLDVVQELTKVVKLKGSKRIRLIEVHNHKIYRVLKKSEKTTGYHEYNTLRAEEISTEEASKEKGDRRTQVAHYYRDPPIVRNFGDPFHFMLKKGEKFVDTKKRIQTKLQIPDAEFAKWRFAVVTWIGKIVYLEEDDVTVDKIENTDYLGLEHAMPRRQYRPTETPLVIKSVKKPEGV